MNRCGLPLLLILLCTNAQADGSIGSIAVNNAWIAEAPPVTGFNAGYLEIYNNGEHAVALLTVSSPVFEKIEIHKTSVENAIAKMQYVESMNIEPGAAVAFTPGGYHLMLFNAEQPLKTGDTIPLTLEFSGGVRLTVQASVKQRSDPAHEHAH